MNHHSKGKSKRLLSISEILHSLTPVLKSRYLYIGLLSIFEFCFPDLSPQLYESGENIANALRFNS